MMAPSPRALTNRLHPSYCGFGDKLANHPLYAIPQGVKAIRFGHEIAAHSDSSCTIVLSYTQNT